MTYLFMFSLPQTGGTPLYIASQKNNVKVVEILLSAGASVNLARNVRLVSYLSDFNIRYCLSFAAYIVWSICIHVCVFWSGVLL